MFKSIITLSTVFYWMSFSSLSLAQIRGENSSEFFQEGQEQIDTEIERIENQRESKEDDLEQTLEIQEPQQPDVQEVPDIPGSLDDNLPESPEQEVEVEF